MEISYTVTPDDVAGLMFYESDGRIENRRILLRKRNLTAAVVFVSFCILMFTVQYIAKTNLANTLFFAAFIGLFYVIAIFAVFPIQRKSKVFLQTKYLIENGEYKEFLGSKSVRLSDGKLIVSENGSKGEYEKLKEVFDNGYDSYVFFYDRSALIIPASAFSDLERRHLFIKELCKLSNAA